MGSDDITMPRSRRRRHHRHRVPAAAGDAAKVKAVVYADPECTVTTHEISVQSSTGSYWFRIRNLPSPDNPATSGLVPFAVLRALQDLAGRRETLI